MKKITIFIAFLLFGSVAFSQMPAAITLDPPAPTAYESLTLTLDATKSCPVGGLFHADSVMIHSGVTIAGSPWQLVVGFDQLGVNGQQPKLVRVGPGFPMAITITPANATVDSSITITLDAKKSCPVDALLNADSVKIHSGVTVNGSAWQNVINFDGLGANGQKPMLTYNGDSTWSITIIPKDFYGTTATDTVTAINCVFNGGDWSLGEGKDFDDQGNCTDFTIPIGQPDVFKWSVTYIPADFYGIAAGEVVEAINCVFNAGDWSAGEGKDFDLQLNCVDFTVPLSITGIDETNLNTIAVYPNPVNDKLTIANLSGINTIEIINISGELVRKIDETSLQTINVNTSNLAKGFYFIRVINQAGIITTKFVKE